MGLFRYLVFGALVVWLTLSLAGRAGASVSVGPAVESDAFYVALTGVDATGVPSIREVGSGVPLAKSAIRADANVTVYRVAGCANGSFEVHTPASYQLFPCGRAVGSVELNRVVLVLDDLVFRLAIVEAELRGLNATGSLVQGGVSGLDADVGVLSRASGNLSAAVSVLDAGVRQIVIPQDLVLGSDLDGAAASIQSAVVAEGHRVPLWAYALGGGLLVSTATNFYLWDRSRRASAVVPSSVSGLPVPAPSKAGSLAESAAEARVFDDVADDLRALRARQVGGNGVVRVAEPLVEVSAVKPVSIAVSAKEPEAVAGGGGVVPWPPRPPWGGPVRLHPDDVSVLAELMKAAARPATWDEATMGVLALKGEPSPAAVVEGPSGSGEVFTQPPPRPSLQPDPQDTFHLTVPAKSDNGGVGGQA